MRVVYVLLTYLLAPIVMALEGWKAFWNPDYRGRLHQRLGFVAKQDRPGCLWVHAVSVGEVQAAAGLIREMRRRVPGLDVVLTTVTPTGAQRVKALFGNEVRHCYLPYDLPGSVRRFLDRMRPSVAIIVETEIWPTLYHELGRRRIPLVMASARVSTRSVDRYRLMASLFRETLSHGILIGAQSAADAERFRAIGAAPERVKVTGNIKFDLELPQSEVEAGRDFRLSCASGRPVWIAGSTHEGEEDAVLAAQAIVRARHPSALLILVPRHPQRFDAVAQLLRQRGVPFVRRSDNVPVPADVGVVLGDSMGEMLGYYAAADVVFVGGSLVPLGGQNLIEPIALARPTLVGPHTFNFAEATANALAAGAVRRVDDADALLALVGALLGDRARCLAMAKAALDFHAAHRGAGQRLWQWLAPRIEAAVQPAANARVSRTAGG